MFQVQICSSIELLNGNITRRCSTRKQENNPVLTELLSQHYKTIGYLRQENTAHRDRMSLVRQINSGDEKKLKLSVQLVSLSAGLVQLTLTSTYP